MDSEARRGMRNRSVEGRQSPKGEARLDRAYDRSAPSTSELRICEWITSPYLGRVAIRVARQYGVPSQDVPDLVQELRLALWKASPDLSVSAGWIFQTARHKAIDCIKRRRRRAEVGLEGLALTAPDSEPDLALRCLLRSEASRLPDALRRFYTLRYEEGRSQR